MPDVDVLLLLETAWRSIARGLGLARHGGPDPEIRNFKCSGAVMTNKTFGNRGDVIHKLCSLWK